MFGGTILALTTILAVCSGESQVTEEVKAEVKRSQVIVVCLGGAEEREMTSLIASLLFSLGHHVALFTYGGGGAGGGAEAGGGGGGGGVEVKVIPVTQDDLLYAQPGHPTRYIVPSKSAPGLYDVTAPGDEASTNHIPPRSYDAIVTSSRRHACKQTLEGTTWAREQISRAKIFATPLHFHDLCTLTLASQFDLPVVGLVTSPTGSWWSWYHLDLLPELSVFAVPPNLMPANIGFLDRFFNVLEALSYITKMYSLWADPLMTSLPSTANEPISVQYGRVASVVAAYDWLLYPDLPVTPLVTSLAGARWREEVPLDKDILGPALRNRNGVIVVNLKMEELWVGAAAQEAILEPLSATPFTVVWRGVGEAREGVGEGGNSRGGAGKENSSAIFVQRENLPIRELLGHPRHRLLLSLCGLNEVSLAMVYGSPVLCLPVTPDQILTSSRLRDLGLAEIVPASDVTTGSVREAVRTLTTNRSYRARGRQLAEDYLDAPLPPSDRVAHAVERLVRRPWRYRRRASHGLSLLARSNGDVIAAMLVLVTSLAGVAICLVCVILRRRFVGRKEEEEKRRKED